MNELKADTHWCMLVIRGTLVAGSRQSRGCDESLEIKTEYLVSSGDEDSRAPNSKYSSAHILVLIFTGMRETRLTLALRKVEEGLAWSDLPTGSNSVRSSASLAMASFASW